MKVRYICKDIDAIDVFTIGKIYEVLEPDALGVVCIDDNDSESVMFTEEYEVVE